MHVHVGIIFRPRLFAPFSFLFIVCLLILQHVESWNAQECFSMQGREKMVHRRKFSASPTGHKVEMASANADLFLETGKSTV